MGLLEVKREDVKVILVEFLLVTACLQLGSLLSSLFVSIHGAFILEEFFIDAPFSLSLALFQSSQFVPIVAIDVAVRADRSPALGAIVNFLQSVLAAVPLAILFALHCSLLLLQPVSDPLML